MYISAPTLDDLLMRVFQKLLISNNGVKASRGSTKELSHFAGCVISDAGTGPIPHHHVNPVRKPLDICLFLCKQAWLAGGPHSGM
jgi:hypothetical protein